MSDGTADGWITTLVWYALWRREGRCTRQCLRHTLAAGDPEKLRDLEVIEALLS